MGARVVRVALAAALVTALAACAPSSGERVEITIHYSHFEPAELSVPHGVPITFVLVNTDPIDHEWLIGDSAFHARHRTGTEPQHGERPSELSIPALSTVTTTITFDEPITLRYICHLPRHEAYGMVGSLTVT